MATGAKSYVFVDGNWLRQTVADMERLWFHEPIDISYSMLLHDTHAEKGFFYDAYPPEGDPDYASKLELKEREFAEISDLRGWHVNAGISKGVGRRLRQKGVDVKLALDAMNHRLRGNIATAVLVAGDLDFLPLITSLVEAGTWVQLWCDPLKTPPELYRAADERVFIGPNKVHRKGASTIFQISGSKRRTPAWRASDRKEIPTSSPTRDGAYDGAKYLFYDIAGEGRAFRITQGQFGENVEEWRGCPHEEQIFYCRHTMLGFLNPPVD